MSGKNSTILSALILCICTSASAVSFKKNNPEIFYQPGEGNVAFSLEGKTVVPDYKNETTWNGNTITESKFTRDEEKFRVYYSPKDGWALSLAAGVKNEKQESTTISSSVVSTSKHTGPSDVELESTHLFGNDDAAIFGLVGAAFSPDSARPATASNAYEGNNYSGGATASLGLGGFAGVSGNLFGLFVRYDAKGDRKNVTDTNPSVNNYTATGGNETKGTLFYELQFEQTKFDLRYTVYRYNDYTYNYDSGVKADFSGFSYQGILLGGQYNVTDSFMVRLEVERLMYNSYSIGTILGSPVEIKPFAVNQVGLKLRYEF
jgi:hypothetical protein